MSFVAEIQANIDNFQKNLDKAQARMDAFSEGIGIKIAKLGSSFISLGKGLSVGVTAPMVAAGTAAFIMAADFEDALGATNQIFKEASDATQQWANNLPTYFGIAKKEALEYSNMMGSMLVNIGNLTEKEASEQSAKLIELAGDLTAMYGGTTQDAVRALTGALKGNNTMLDNYGMAANDALVKAKALSLGLVEQGKEMSLSAKQAATLALIYEQSGAAQGQAAREADGASGSMRAFRTEITNLTTEIGANLLPIITPIITRLKEIVAGFRALSPETQKTILVVSGLAAAIGPLLLGLGTLMQVAPLVGAAFATMTGPIGLTVIAIGAAVALIIKYWDDIKAYFTTGSGAKAWDSLYSGAVKIWNNLVAIFNQVRDYIIGIWDKIGSNLKSIVGNSFDTVFTIISTVINSIVNVMTAFTSLLRGDFSGAFEALKNLVSNIFSGIKTIIVNVIANVSQVISGFLKLIGADGLGIGLENWANGLKPVKEESVKVAAAVGDISNKLITNTGKVVENTTALTGNTKAQRDYRTELTNTLASWGMYDAQLKVLQDSYTKLNDVAVKAKATQEEFQTIMSRQWADTALLNFDKIGDVFKSSGLDIKTAITIPVTAKVDADFSALNDKLEGVKANLNNISLNISDIASSAISEMINSMAGAISNGDSIIKAVGAALLGTLGGVMVQLGTMAIMIGLGIERIKTALLTLSPTMAIAAGVALIGLGAAFSYGAAQLGKSMGSGGGGASSSYTSSVSPVQDYLPRGSYYNNDSQKVELKIRGNNLVGSYEINKNRNNRLG